VKGDSSVSSYTSEASLNTTSSSSTTSSTSSPNTGIENAMRNRGSFARERVYKTVLVNGCLVYVQSARTVFK
ncbi:hypothetical protein AB4618_26285, partial [Vibrio sp. 10N.222.48.A8]|uniref:hypothetical protein n=1 Tax=Vibrio sp. 10N.222.48.A8 TaxID=3229606 RepID=UPI00354FBFD1